MIKENVLKEFPSWSAEKQIAEYQAYKSMGDYSPFSEIDYQLMEMVMNNPNAEIECENGVCSIIESEITEEKLEEDIVEALDALDALEHALLQLKYFKNNKKVNENLL